MDAHMARSFVANARRHAAVPWATSIRMRSGTGGPVKALTCRPWASNLRISSSVLANLCLSICLCLNCVRAAKGDRLAQSNVVHLEFGAAAIGVLGMSHERLRRTDVNGCVSAANFGALTSAFVLSYMLSYLAVIVSSVLGHKLSVLAKRASSGSLVFNTS